MFINRINAKSKFTKFILDDYKLCSDPIEFMKNQKHTHSILADELFKNRWCRKYLI